MANNMTCCNPFVDRLCRDIRNGLSKALMTSLDQLDLAPVKIVTKTFLSGNLQPRHKRYIESRLEAYSRVMQSILSSNITDPFDRALVLWDEELFFEVHEILEQVWLHSEGAAKCIFQAMIRAAGMYVQLDRDNMKGATSVAAKAVEAFEHNRDAVPDSFNLDLLLAKLRIVDPVPPKLFVSARKK